MEKIINEIRKFEASSDASNKEETEEESSFVLLWKDHPSSAHLNVNIFRAKSLAAIALFGAIFSLLMLNEVDAWMSLSLTIALALSSVLIFANNSYSLSCARSSLSLGLKKFDPFKELTFWQHQDHQDRLFFSHQRDAVHDAVAIFKVEVMPENLTETLHNFILGLAFSRIPFTYQVVHSPLNHESTSGANRNQRVNSAKSFKVSVHFAVFRRVTGVMFGPKLAALHDDLTDTINNIKGLFVANYHHYKITLLRGMALINAIRTLTTKKDIPVQENVKLASSERPFSIILKPCYIIGIILLLMSLLSRVLTVSFEIMVLASIILGLALIFLYWRNVPYQSVGLMINRNPSLVEIAPFHGLDFYKGSGAGNSIFIHSPLASLLMGVRTIQVKHVQGESYVYPGKFYRSLMKADLITAQTYHVLPQDSLHFENRDLNAMAERYQRQFLNLKSAAERELWLRRKTGTWDVINTMIVADQVSTADLQRKHFDQLTAGLDRQVVQVMGILRNQYNGFKAEEIRNPHKGLRALTCALLKTPELYLAGSHLQQVAFLGKMLEQLIEMPKELGKGMETNIAAEFNTPTYLENLFTIGKTINTEYLEEEVPAGFTQDQLENLLITNGTYKDQEKMALKLLEGLVSSRVPFIAFDFYGKHSRIIDHFQDSQHEEDFLYFKLGSTFNLKLLLSDLPNDQYNSVYLDHVIDAFALCYKKDERTIENFKQLILNSEGLDFNTLALQYQNTQSFNRSYESSALVALLNEFSQQAAPILKAESLETDNDITIRDFLSTHHSVIIDLSMLYNLKSKLLIAMVLISKLIHYITFNEDFHCKTIVLPDTDIIFNEKYLDKWGSANYSKIDKFLRPLRERGFGLVFLANHVSQFHHTIFTYFNNLLTFRATDQRDLLTLKTLMNLQDYHGAGIYSRSRKNTYQLDYLKTLKPGQALVKRDDIHSVFPILIDISSLLGTSLMTNAQLLDYMGGQGYRQHERQQQILASAKETMLEADLGNYFLFFENGIEGLKQFLEHLTTFRKLSLFDQLIKDELFKRIRYRAKEILGSKRKMLTVRDEIFEVLIKKGYLEPGSQVNPSGSHSMRTAYKVGEHYRDVMDDYYRIKKAASGTVEILQKESSISDAREFLEAEPLKPRSGASDAPPRSTKKEVNAKTRKKEMSLDQINHDSLVAKEVGSFFIRELQRANYDATMGELEKARKRLKQVIPQFLLRIYGKSKGHVIPLENTLDNIEPALHFLTENGIIPLNYRDTFQAIQEITDMEDLQQMHEKVFLIYSQLMEFVNKHSFTAPPKDSNALDEEMFFADNDEELRGQLT